MRGYGIPRQSGLQNVLPDDMANTIGMDPYEFRLKNCMEDGLVDPKPTVLLLHTYGLKRVWHGSRKEIYPLG